jgi:hypothetical protein
MTTAAFAGWLVENGFPLNPTAGEEYRCYLCQAAGTDHDDCECAVGTCPDCGHVCPHEGKHWTVEEIKTNLLAMTKAETFTLFVACGDDTYYDKGEFAIMRYEFQTKREEMAFIAGMNAAMNWGEDEVHWNGSEKDLRRRCLDWDDGKKTPIKVVDFVQELAERRAEDAAARAEMERTVKEALGDDFDQAKWDRAMLDDDDEPDSDLENDDDE